MCWFSVVFTTATSRHPTTLSFCLLLTLTTYNGWTNYETWLTNLHFEDFTDHFSEMVEEGQFDEMTDDEILDCCADYLNDYIDDYISQFVRTTDNFIVDVIQSFVHEIDYKDIAEHYVADIIEAIRNKEAA